MFLPPSTDFRVYYAFYFSFIRAQDEESEPEAGIESPAIRILSPCGASIHTFDSADTEQADLRGGRSPWFAGATRIDRRPLDDNLRCDALIVGRGITGSLMAEPLTQQELDVVIIGRELPGRGRTAASTSMPLWEIDRSLRELTSVYGFERAARAYRASFEAVHGLKSLVQQLGLPCEMHAKDSLYLAAGNTRKDLT